MPEHDTTRQPRFAADEPDSTARPSGVQLRARRNPRLIALGVLTACLGALGVAYLYSATTSSQQVLVMASEVARGTVVQPGDLTVVTIGSAQGITVTDAGALDSVVGQTALVDLPKGSLLTPTSVGSPTLPAGTARVGLKLTVGRFPVGDLPSGAKVTLVRTGDGSDKASYSAETLTPAKDLGDGQTFLVDVQVAEGDAPAVARLAAEEALALVRRADG
ncbi:MAG: SAF domain-containing protein [Propionibacteriaceae bacterium]|nr:SAF domain-containing protein [Propionibacteriaceae bacterium]